MQLCCCITRGEALWNIHALLLCQEAVAQLRVDATAGNEAVAATWAADCLP